MFLKLLFLVSVQTSCSILPRLQSSCDSIHAFSLRLTIMAFLRYLKTVFIFIPDFIDRCSSSLIVIPGHKSCPHSALSPYIP
ncbi:hypothetical protein BD770DRAFT_397184 [Pilaira anomala]|nr:hypothetical protein BD770DRAFT_397184 [Pilaira anomala]